MVEEMTPAMLGAMRRRVENLLTERGMTTKWLYEGIGMSKVGYRQMWERDSIKVRSLVSIARRLGVTVSWLMGEGAPDQAAEPPSPYRRRYLEDRVDELERRMARIEDTQRRKA